MSKHHAHPISVHTPNGLLPVTVFFILLSAAFNLYTLDFAAYYNLIFVLIVMPFVLFLRLCGLAAKDTAET